MVMLLYKTTFLIVLQKKNSHSFTIKRNDVGILHRVCNNMQRKNSRKETFRFASKLLLKYLNFLKRILIKKTAITTNNNI